MRYSCHQALLNDDGISALGSVFHVDCFVCTHCEKAFREQPYYVRSGRAYCKSDYLSLFAKSVCAGCMGSFRKGDVAMEAVNKVRAPLQLRLHSNSHSHLYSHAHNLLTRVHASDTKCASVGDVRGGGDWGRGLGFRVTSPPRTTPPLWRPVWAFVAWLPLCASASSNAPS